MTTSTSHRHESRSSSDLGSSENPSHLPRSVQIDRRVVIIILVAFFLGVIFFAINGSSRIPESESYLLAATHVCVSITLGGLLWVLVQCRKQQLSDAMPFIVTGMKQLINFFGNLLMFVVVFLAIGCAVYVFTLLF